MLGTVKTLQSSKREPAREKKRWKNETQGITAHIETATREYIIDKEAIRATTFDIGYIRTSSPSRIAQGHACIASQVNSNTIGTAVCNSHTGRLARYQKAMLDNVADNVYKYICTEYALSGRHG